MENKDLQELFAAKRTTEANRRRQEELRRKLEATAAPAKSCRLWPVWAGAAAASIALLIASLPLLITNSQPASMPIAQAEIPTVAVPAEADVTPAPAMTMEPIKAIKPTRPRTAEWVPDTETVAIAEDPIEEPIEEYEPIEPVIVKPLAQEQKPAGPRIHRRTSTRMVSAPVEVRNESRDWGQLLADAFGSEEATPLNLSTFKM